MVAPAPQGENLADLFGTATSVVDPSTGIADLLGALLAARPPWMADALCAEHPEVSFFPGQGGDLRAPKLTCARCLVRVECRQWALAQGPDLDGIWSGTTPGQRQQMRRAAEDPATRRRPVRLMERLSAHLAQHPDEEHSVSSLKAISGNRPLVAEALDLLAAEGYLSVTVGGTRHRRYYPDVRFYRHAELYIDRGAVTVVATAPDGRSTAA